MKYKWDTNRQVYVDEQKRVVTSRAFHALLNILVGKVSDHFVEIEDDRIAGRISSAEAQARFQREIGLANRMMSALGWGGLAQTPSSARNATDSKVRLDVMYYLRFQAERPRLSDDQARARASLYAGSIYTTFQSAARQAHASAGFTHARRVLDSAAEHCEGHMGVPGCPELARRGWVEIDKLVPIGDASCRASCRCEVEYQRGEQALTHEPSAALEGV
jgi:hypothetical protein